MAEYESGSVRESCRESVDDIVSGEDLGGDEFPMCFIFRVDSRFNSCRRISYCHQRRQFRSKTCCRYSTFCRWNRSAKALSEYWVRLWSDTGATSDSDGVPCVEPKLSSTKVRQTLSRQTLSNLTRLPHQTKTAVPNWFRRRSFAVLNSSVRFGTWVERRLNRAWVTYRLCCFILFFKLFFGFILLLYLSDDHRIPSNVIDLYWHLSHGTPKRRWLVLNFEF